MHTGKHPQGQEGGKSAFDFYNFMFKLSPNSTSSEAKGPCPRCGGDDRFWIRPDGTFGCRKCNPGKDNPAAYKLIKDELRSLGWNPDGPTPEAGPMQTRGERNKKPRQPNCLRAHWRKKFGPHDHEHAYRTAAGESFSVLRWNADPDKERPEPIIRPSKRALQGPFLPLEYNEIPEGGTLVVCEGERTCDAIRAAGFNATTWKGGTGAVQKTDWSAVRDCKVVLWPDDDEGGRKAMRWLRYRLQSQGCVTHTVETEGLNDGNDAADIKRAGALEGKIQQAMYEADRPELKEADPGDKPEESRAAIPLPRKWVMPENFKMPEQILEYSLQAGSTSLLYGGSGSGKSTIMVSEILSLVTGRALLGGKAPDKTGVMVYEVDESKDGFNSRMIAAMKHHRIDAAEVEDRLFFEDDDWPGALNASDIPKLEDSLDAIAEVMRLNGCRAFYIDALASAAMGVEKDPDIANLVFGLVVQKICRPLNAAVKWVHHSRKKGPGYAEEAGQGRSPRHGRDHGAVEDRAPNDRGAKGGRGYDLQNEQCEGVVVPREGAEGFQLPRSADGRRQHSAGRSGGRAAGPVRARHQRAIHRNHRIDLEGGSRIPEGLSSCRGLGGKDRRRASPIGYRRGQEVSKKPTPEQAPGSNRRHDRRLDRRRTSESCQTRCRGIEEAGAGAYQGCQIVAGIRVTFPTSPLCPTCGFTSGEIVPPPPPHVGVWGVGWGDFLRVFFSPPEFSSGGVPSGGKNSLQDFLLRRTAPPWDPAAISARYALTEVGAPRTLFRHD